MKKVKRKIISGAVFFGCAVFALAAASKINSNSGSVPVSLISSEDDKPIIVLDAGHDEST